MNPWLSLHREKIGGAGLRARQNHGRPGTAAPPEYSLLGNFSDQLVMNRWFTRQA